MHKEKKNSDTSLSTSNESSPHESLDESINPSDEQNETKVRLRLTKSIEPSKTNEEDEIDDHEDNKVHARRTKSADLKRIAGTRFIPCQNVNEQQCVVNKGSEPEPCPAGKSNGRTDFSIEHIANGLYVSEKFNSASETVFDPYDEIYLANACCDCMHYRTATAVVGILEIIFIFIWAGVGICYYMLDGVTESAKGIIGCQVAAGVVLLITIALLFVGVVLQNHIFLYPHMCLQLIGITVALILTVLAVIVMAVGNNMTENVFGFLFGHDKVHLIEEHFGPIWPFCLACIFDFKAAIGIWFFVIVKGYYDYLQDKICFEQRDCNNLCMNVINNNCLKSTPAVASVTND